MSSFAQLLCEADERQETPWHMLSRGDQDLYERMADELVRSSEFESFMAEWGEPEPEPGYDEYALNEEFDRGVRSGYEQALEKVKAGIDKLAERGPTYPDYSVPVSLVAA